MKIICAAVVAVSTVLLIIVAVSATLVTGSGISVVAASPSALADIPPTYLAAYQGAAATCPGLPWTVLAGIGKVESDHGRSTLPGVRSGANSAGAQGPMQFLPATFARYGSPAPPGGTDPPPRSIRSMPSTPPRACCVTPAPATPPTCARRSGATTTPAAYVHNVLATAARYTAPPLAGSCRPTPDAAVARAAGRNADRRRSRDAESVGGHRVRLRSTRAALRLGRRRAHRRRVRLLRTDRRRLRRRRDLSATHRTNPARRRPAPACRRRPHPGRPRLLRHPLRVHHVGLYLGHGLMINAPTYGQPVQVGPYRYRGDDYLGATRPAARATTRR